MKILKCKYCNKEFETDGTRKGAGKFAVHVRQCEKNPNRQNILNGYKLGGHNSGQGIRNHLAKLEDEKTRKPRKFICKKCENEFFINLTDNEYEFILSHPNSKNVKKTCSKKCAHSRNNTKATKLKRSLSLKRFWQTNLSSRRRCKNCKNPINKSSLSRTYCSIECKEEWYKKNQKSIKLKLSNAGKKSASIKNKRSKNEMYFCELCEKEFKNVGHNEPIFNGWDADVLLYDIRVAILWNGKWHYETVFEKQKSSLKQIQNRDKIKEKEILAAGWKLYIIKDMGGYDPIFVEQEFKKFMASQFNGRTGEP